MLGFLESPKRPEKEKEFCQYCENRLCDAQKFNNQCFSCGKQPK